MTNALVHTGSGPLAGRRFVPDLELATLVAQDIEAHIVARNSFTAYAITRSLRQANPTLELAHERVRAAVHQAMDVARRPGAPAEGWAARTQPFAGGKTATCYSPPSSSGTTVLIQ